MRFGRFEVEGQVGAGASSEVYRATDPQSGALVAVKRLTGAVPADVRARLQAEAENLAALDDRHVVRLVDAGLTDDPPWLAQTWVDGVSLQRLLQVHGRLTGEQACGVLLGAARGLGHAHSRGVLHRDVSPGNVLLDGSGTSMLVDFGLAAAVGSSGVVGTPAFVSPEAASGSALDPRSDVYSAGAVLYLLLAGRPPFPAADTDQVLAAHRTTAAPGLEGPADGLADLVARCLSKDPQVRPADGAALAAELEEQAERRYGAGWLARASVAGLVGAALPAAGGGGAAAGGASAARETAVLSTGAVDTGSAPVAAVAPAAASAADAAPPAAEESPPVRPRATRKALATVAAAAAVVIVSTFVAVAATGGDDDEEAAALPTSPAQPSPSAAAEGDDDEAGDGVSGTTFFEGTYREVTTTGFSDPSVNEGPYRMTVACTDVCVLDGFGSYWLSDGVTLGPPGSGRYEAEVPAAGDQCDVDSDFNPPTTVVAELSGDTLTVRGTNPIVETTCPDGVTSTWPSWDFTFNGTRAGAPGAPLPEAPEPPGSTQTADGFG